MNKSKGVYLLKALLFILLFVNTACSDHKQSTSVKDTYFSPKKELSSDSINNDDLPKLKLLQVVLKKHIDGDTTEFYLNGEPITVRYLLIDTPETVKLNTDPQLFGKEASERTEKLLENAKTICIMLDNGNSKDRYNRTLAYVFVDGELLQNTLVREGLARIAYVSHPNTTYLEQLTISEDIAKQQGIGIWGVEGYVNEKGFN